MFLSMNWISDFVDLSGVDLRSLIGRFTLATAEVEDIYEFGNDTKDVVVGKILSIENHPNSKKLHLLKVDNGTEIVDCVCGAPNVFEGALVAFAKCGGSVKGMAIGAATVAGYMSYGMCCSEKELGISEDHSGLLILNDILDEMNSDRKVKIKVGDDIKSFMDIEDTVFEVDNKSLTNRPDLWGHYGIAREIAALVKRPLKELEVAELDKYSKLPQIDMAIETPYCFRYSCMSVTNVTKKVSPLNMKLRLMHCGQRPINLLADLTNYLMMELGQPMHAFDKDKVSRIRVKTFDEPKKFMTLDNTERTIEPGIMMICDGDVPVAAAGIMGGLLSEITDDTTSLLLESANFDGVSVRKSATKLGMRTEASARYEKTLDPELTVPAIGRFIKLLNDIDHEVKVTSSLTDSYEKKYDAISLSFDKAYVDKYTGIDIGADQIEETLTALKFKVKRHGNNFTVGVPSFRATKDVTIKADIIEEITRIYGYDNFELHSTNSLLAPIRQDTVRENEYRAKQLLADRFGMSEVHSYIWYDTKTNKDLGIEAEGDARIINSVTAENDMIRQSIIPTLLGFVQKNLDNYSDIKIFEIGRVVLGYKEDGLCNERKVLSLVAASRDKKENELLADVKEIADTLTFVLKNKKLNYKPLTLESDSSAAWRKASKLIGELYHPKNSAAISIDGNEIGYISVLNPRIADKIDKKLNAAILEIDYKSFAEAEYIPVQSREASKFPGIYIDLSLLVDDSATFGSIRDIVMGYDCKYLQECEYIDVFKDASMPDGKRSMTVRLWFQSFEGTLSGEEVNKYVQDILQNLEKNDIKMKM